MNDLTIDRPTIQDYEMLRLIGRGSYGDVWLARGVTGVFRAIKVVWRARFPNAEPFEREFRGLSQFAEVSLAEINQLALLHVGRNDAAGFFYYVMEVADDAETGQAIEPLRYLPLTVKELRLRLGRIPADQTIAFGIDLAQALAGLHARGLVHRDVKPSNAILVHGRAKLADIGLVTSSAVDLSLVGTEGFIAPEGPGTPAADVFALGKLLYECSTGNDRLSFPQLPDALEGLPDQAAILELNEVLLRACEPDPILRYPDAGAMLQDLQLLQNGRSLRTRRRRRMWWRVAAGCAVVAALLAASVWALRRGADGLKSALSGEPAPLSIAVLPFANLSKQGDADAFFVDGVHEDILADLAHIGAFHVVSRTTVMQYRNSTRSLRQIARELGVKYVLEGSVERSGDGVRVNGQLIDAASDQLVWVKSFDSKLTDLFAIQTELAGEIAGALNTKLNAQERTELERRPTDNLEAYELFLKARELGNRDPSALDDRQSLLSKAVSLDPNFSQAWGELADVHAFSYFTCLDHSPARLAQAKAAIDTSLRLAPNATETIYSLAIYYYYADRDYSRALEQLDKLRWLQPYDPTSYNWRGLVLRRQGRWAEAAAALRKAVQLDPANIGYLHNLEETLEAGRRYAEARQVEARLADILPGNDAVEAKLHLAEMSFAETGSAEAMTTALRRVPESGADRTRLLEMKKSWALEAGDWAEAVRLDRLEPRSAHPQKPEELQSCFVAMAYAALGHAGEARARAAEALGRMRELVREQPDNPAYWTSLAGLEAVGGDADAAVADAKRATELIPESLDAIDGRTYRVMLAVVYAWTGRKELAIQLLPGSLHAPSVWGASPFALRHGIWFAPLHHDPRFLALVNDPKNREPLF